MRNILICRDLCRKYKEKYKERLKKMTSSKTSLANINVSQHYMLRGEFHFQKLSLVLVLISLCNVCNVFLRSHLGFEYLEKR